MYQTLKSILSVNNKYSFFLLIAVIIGALLGVSEIYLFIHLKRY